MSANLKLLLHTWAGLLIVASMIGGTASAREARPLPGACYGPFRNGQAPGGPYPTANEIRSDIVSMERIYGCIRTYGTEAVMSYSSCKSG